MLYNSIDGEVDVSALLELENKTFIFPKIVGDDIISVKEGKLNIGKYNIPEPDGTEFNGQIDAVIVPMCAFDKNNNRLGFGKGYYDRFLKGKNCLKIGVAFSLQEVGQIETKLTDIPMDIIVTEKYILERIR